ncbi:hypothetical protein GCM10010349_34620 [Streptomyces flavofungini]|nr:hypothetical protein GCM10010349_34620 [Streptomyces flavofungini]
MATTSARAVRQWSKGSAGTPEPQGGAAAPEAFAPEAAPAPDVVEVPEVAEVMGARLSRIASHI